MSKRNFSSRMFSNWVTMITCFYHPHRYYLGMENIPSDGHSVVMVGNHQNCMNDPVNVEVALKDRKPYCLVRGDIFRVNKYFGKFLYWLGLLPVNRLNFEGLNGSANAKESNKATFSEASQWLAEGNTLILFPEGGHQNKRYLGYFSLGYLLLAFQAAEKMNFEKEVYVMPFGHHYANYHHPLYDFVLRMGTPIPLSPYYEQYKVKPRTTMREVNLLVEAQIRELMLNVTDLEHYTAIDELRQGPEGRKYALKHGFNPDNLYEKLLADKQLVVELSDPAKKPALDKLQVVETEIKEKGMRDWVLDKEPGVMNLIIKCLLLLVLFPLFAASLAITWPAVFIPHVMYHKKINGAVDEMFRSTWNLGFAALATLPLLWVLPTIIMLFIKPLWALCFFFGYPIMTYIVLRYCRLFGKTCGVWRFVTGKESKRIVKERREAIEELGL
ncbi:MAG: 1-acyl-sn-glycerol-3-phosphate acyltransferase [Bacteroidales bacterium]|nr:1-acyl-sn-glycerol-3-phosphate acyltransferase [Bacteroidales bacterium]